MTPNEVPMNQITADQDGDYSRSFQRLRPLLASREGVRYVDFIKTLKPSYRRLYADIALGYVALIVTCVLIVAVPAHGIAPAWISAGLGSLAIGFWVAYLQLFIHEGAHFNFSSTRDWSDVLCNVLIAWMIGTSVQKYRLVHFQHHRELGGINDSEMTYFFPLNLMFVAKGLFGIRVIEVLASREALHTQKQTVRETKGKYIGFAGLLVHFAIIAIAYAFGSIWLVLAWIVGIGAVFPFFGALRQLLEHRDVSADPDIDYSKVEHGAYTRVFGTDAFSSMFGGAGFNRHLLHHWEPSISYTNLAQLEGFLLDTDAACLIEMRRSSYFKTFADLFRLR